MSVAQATSRLHSRPAAERGSKPWACISRPAPRKRGPQLVPNSVDVQTLARTAVQTTSGRKPVVSTYDMTPDAHDALLWTVNHVCAPGDLVLLVHALCDPRQLHTTIATGRATDSGWVQSVDSFEDVGMETMTDVVKLYVDRLTTKARRSLEQSAAECEMEKKGVEYEVVVPVLTEPQSAASIGQIIIKAAEEADARMLVMANHGPGALADFGSVVRYCYQHCPLPLLLIPRGVVDTAPDRQSRPPCQGHQKTPDLSTVGQGAPDIADSKQGVKVTHGGKSAKGSGGTAAAGAAAAQGGGQSAGQGDGGGKEEQREEAEGERPGSPGEQGTEGQGALPATGEGQDVVMVVNSLEECLEHYVWVADNLCQQGDYIQVWHTGVEVFSVPEVVEHGMQKHGVGLAFSGSIGSLVERTSVGELGDKICQLVDSPHIKAVAMVNSFRRQGLVREGLCGSLASHLTRHCRKPLMLMQPVHVDTGLEHWSC